MERGDNGEFVGNLDTEPGYSYVNWKFIVEMENGSESHMQMLASVGESGQTVVRQWNGGGRDILPGG